MVRAVDRVGRYRLIAPLGAGSTGRVYAACDDRLHRLVALKIVGSRHQVQATRAMARVSHPNLVTVFEVGESEGTFFIAMELVRGQSLSDWLGERLRSSREIVSAFAAAGRGLAAAHRAGFVHGDFKPDNVTVEPSGRVRIIDFGLACPRGTADQDRAIAGTPRFMAPEQFRGEPVYPSSDQFAFCVALYFALYGEWAFGGETIAQIAHAVLHGAARPPRRRRRPRGLERLVLSGLAADPAARHPSMDFLLGHLDDLFG